MGSISNSAAGPLNILIEAAIIPEMARWKVDSPLLSKEQADEHLDALDHNAVTWTQMLWEWAVEDGQIDLSKHAESAPVNRTGFCLAMIEIQERGWELEFSIPLRGHGFLGPVDGRVPLKPLPAWERQRLHLIERSDWIPVALKSLKGIERRAALKKRPKKELRRMSVFAEPAVQVDKGHPFGETWVRLSKRTGADLHANLVDALEVFGRTGKSRMARVRDLLHRQQRKMDATALKDLNAHLSRDSFYDTLLWAVDECRKKADSVVAQRMVEKVLKDIREMVETPNANVEKGRNVFISYARRDKVWLDRLVTMLSPLVRDKTVEVWYDRKIRPSQEWRLEIEKALCAAKVGVLLVTDNFLASDFINDNELPYLLSAAKERAVKIVWVYISHCMYRNTPLAKMQAVTSDLERPLDSFNASARTWELKKVCEAIEQAARGA